MQFISLQVEKPSDSASSLRVAKADGRVEDKAPANVPASAVCKVHLEGEHSCLIYMKLYVCFDLQQQLHMLPLEPSFLRSQLEVGTIFETEQNFQCRTWLTVALFFVRHIITEVKACSEMLCICSCQLYHGVSACTVLCQCVATSCPFTRGEDLVLQGFFQTI